MFTRKPLSRLIGTWGISGLSAVFIHGCTGLSNVTDDRAMANPARELDRKVMSQSIHDALDKLTPRERTVFELKHYQGLKLRTIGEMLSTTEETAKNTLFRATRKLRASLAEHRS
jgi:RNA polymerase sigma-70 factor (ECF subfamily)